MSGPPEEIIKRAKAIQGKVNLLEGLHKTCQLQLIGLSEPILNESRYLARALSDVLYNWDSQNGEIAKNLATAELAVHSGINDAVDILITHVKSTLVNLETAYKDFEIATSSFGDDYIAALEAINEVDKLVVNSRKNRTDRVEIYSKLADVDQSSFLDTISDFALKLPQIEAIAQRDGAATEPSDGLMPYLLTALDGKSETTYFTIYLQPKYERKADGDKCIGAEALLRFSAEGNQLPPQQVISYAEQNQLITRIDMMVLRKALNILKDNPDIPSISVNVSAFDLLLPDYSDQVLEMISEVSGDPKRLELEITEGTVINDESSFMHLQKISKTGVRISIDDFGTGETRFDYLAKLPINVIKIDKSLVDSYKNAPASYGTLISAIGAVGNSCSIEVLAEGLETAADVTNLHELGISKYQGFYFGKPEPLEEFMACNREKF